MEKKLSQYHQGDRLEVTRIAASGRLKNRLIELGIRRGQELVIVRYAPLKDPLEVNVAGCNVSLRVEEADLILVRPADPDDASGTGSTSGPEAAAEAPPKVTPGTTPVVTIDADPEDDCRGAL